MLTAECGLKLKMINMRIVVIFALTLMLVWACTYNGDVIVTDSVKFLSPTLDPDLHNEMVVEVDDVDDIDEAIDLGGG